MVIWENVNIKVENEKGEWCVQYKDIKISYNHESLKQVISDIRFEIFLEMGNPRGFMASVKSK